MSPVQRKLADLDTPRRMQVGIRNVLNGPTRRSQQSVDLLARVLFWVPHVSPVVCVL